MGMQEHLTFLLLLLSLYAPGAFVKATALPDLPRVVTLSEDTVPGALVAEVSVSCSNMSGSPNVTLDSIEPDHPFNPIAISADPTSATMFRAEVTLSAGVELDAHRVNQYTLTLRAACPGEDEVEERLFVRVTLGQVLRCDTPFASAGLSHSYPGTTLQTFRLEIEVMDHHSHNCSGAVTVEVLPSRRPRVTFLEPHRSVMVTEGIGPLEVVTQVHASGENVRYAILAPVAPTLFTIDEVTGEIRSTRRLEVAHAHLLIQAYNALHPADHATATVNVTVQGTDRWAPRCVPAIFVSQVPETVSPGSTLVTLRCTNSTGTDECLHYALEGPPASRSHFCMEGPRLKVNTTLDYDSEAVATVGFQFTATIVVTAGEQPPRSARVPVLVTVTPVNEFRPACPNSVTFTVPETAAFGSVVGRVAGTDRDYPPDSLEYSLEGESGPAQPFSIDSRTGELRVVGPLDSQRQKSYRLVVRLTDTHNDLDLAKRHSRLCDVSVRLQAVPDQVPVCIPEVQELRITAGSPGSRQPVTSLACHGSPDGATLTHTIVGGNEDGCFRLEGNTVVYLPNDQDEPRTFVLLVEVWGGSGARRRSTVVALVVHVTPRSTPVPPSTTTQHTTLQKEPLVVTQTEVVWHPPAWFVAVLTISGTLLLATLGCTARSLLCRNRAPGKLFLGKSSWDVVEQSGGKEEQGHPHANSQGQFDGRAQDPRECPVPWPHSLGLCPPGQRALETGEMGTSPPGQWLNAASISGTGRDYLFNSVTGARRWI
ncbi:cadherin related family member 4 [Pitangus sulphuratus]|nr:cadherin related family member 4 [Pitangus sulphuratus]